MRIPMDPVFIPEITLINNNRVRSDLADHLYNLYWLDSASKMNEKYDPRQGIKAVCHKVAFIVEMSGSQSIRLM